MEFIKTCLIFWMWNFLVFLGSRFSPTFPNFTTLGFPSSSADIELLSNLEYPYIEFPWLFSNTTFPNCFWISLTFLKSRIFLTFHQPATTLNYSNECKLSSLDIYTSIDAIHYLGKHICPLLFFVVNLRSETFFS